MTSKDAIGPGADALLTLAGVEMRYQPDAAPTLSGVDLVVRAGEVVTLLGPSGCGKSTLLRIVAGLTPPWAGEVRWRDGRRPKLGFVFQDAALMPWLTVEANVAEPLRLGRHPEREVAAKVSDALARVGLAHAARAYPRELSGGMRMRTSIARALVARPEFLLMDEPFAALDELTREQLNEDLVRLQREEGLTILFVTHSIQEAVFLSDRLVVLAAHPGRIVHQQAVARPTGDLRDDRRSVEFFEACQAMSALLRQGLASH
jgi:NitT/TauT family transport system ATP-binding protein